MTKNILKSKKAFSLVEILVAIGVFGLVFSSIGFFSVNTVRYAKVNEDRALSSLYMQEIQNAVLMNKSDMWASIISNTDQGDRSLSFSSNRYSIVNGTSIKNGITTKFNLTSVYRDGSGNIVSNGGTNDLHTRLLTITSSWTDILGQAKSLVSKTYINDWNTPSWTQTTQAEFNLGTKTNTVTTNDSGGEVKLGTVVYADWCNPSLTLSAYDLPGQGIAQSITAIPGNAFAGTGNNASGISFANILVDNNDPPNVTVPATYNGFKSNDIFGESGYAYLATDTNSKEIEIVNLSASPYTEAGYFDAPGSGNGNSVYVSGTTGYATVGSKLYAIDLTSKSGSRPSLGSLTLDGTGTSIVVSGNYAYIAISGSATVKLDIVNISNPASMSIVATSNPDSGNGVSLFVSSDTNRVYLATAASATKKEVFIIDTSTKSGSRSIVSSFDTNGMDPKGITYVTGRIIAVGVGGAEYQIFNVDSETSGTLCGSLDVNTNVYDVASVTQSNGNAYSYIVTGDSSSELKIIKGGPGGGYGGGVGYAASGTFTSSVFDTTATSATYNYLIWTGTVPSNTTLKYQIRTGASSDLSSATWYGPDGTSNSFYTAQSGTVIPTLMNNKRYIQYKALFTSDTVSTPILKDITINYQK